MLHLTSRYLENSVARTESSGCYPPARCTDRSRNVSKVLDDAGSLSRADLDTLTSALVVRQLQPWHEDIKKRQVKSPKVYIGDSGLLHGLLNLRHQDDIDSHPKVGT